MISASHVPNRDVINVQILRGLPDNTAYPHLWYVAKGIADRLSVVLPARATGFPANADKFSASLGPPNAAITTFRAKFDRIPIAATEPVAKSLLGAMGFNILPPYSLQGAGRRVTLTNTDTTACRAKQLP